MEASKGKHATKVKNPFKLENKPKGKWKSKKSTMVNKVKGIPTCFHYKKKGHEESQFWKLHLELQPKKFKDKGKQNIIASTHQDLGSDSIDEYKIMEMGSKGISTINLILQFNPLNWKAILTKRREMSYFISEL